MIDEPDGKFHPHTRRTAHDSLSGILPARTRGGNLGSERLLPISVSTPASSALRATVESLPTECVRDSSPIAPQSRPQAVEAPLLARSASA